MVAVEVVGLLVVFAVFVNPVVYLCQGFIAVGNGLEIAVFGVPETGGFAGTVGKADELVEGFAVNC